MRISKKVIIKSQRQFMYGSNFYGSDVMLEFKNTLISVFFNDVSLNFCVIVTLLPRKSWTKINPKFDKIGLPLSLTGLTFDLLVGGG